MKKVICVIAIVLVVVLCVVAYKALKPAENVEVATTENVVSEEETTKGTIDRSNSKLKTEEEIKTQIEASTQKYFEMVYGDKLDEATITKVTVCPDDPELLKYVDLAENDYAFEIEYELKPANKKSVSDLTEYLGTYDEESGLVVVKDGFGVMRYNEVDDTFDVTSINKKEDIVMEDNAEETTTSEIDYSTLSDEEKVEHALFAKLREAYGDQFESAKIVVDKIYTAKEIENNEALKSLDIKDGELAFEVTIDIEPAEGADPNVFMIPNGELNEDNGWVSNMTRLGILTPDGDNSYTIRDFGTGW